MRRKEGKILTFYSYFCLLPLSAGIFKENPSHACSFKEYLEMKRERGEAMCCQGVALATPTNIFFFD
jgi:hypothetical protein